MYVIIYGNFICELEEQFGALMTVGHTLGEEILFGVKTRIETVKAVEEACVM